MKFGGCSGWLRAFSRDTPSLAESRLFIRACGGGSNVLALLLRQGILAGQWNEIGFRRLLFRQGVQKETLCAFRQGDVQFFPDLVDDRFDRTGRTVRDRGDFFVAHVQEQQGADAAFVRCEVGIAGLQPLEESGMEFFKMHAEFLPDLIGVVDSQHFFHFLQYGFAVGVGAEAFHLFQCLPVVLQGMILLAQHQGYFG